MNWVITNDHGAVLCKRVLLPWLAAQGFSVRDRGVQTTERVDYPPLVDKAVDDILSGRADYGLFLCGSGNGVAIRANRYKGIRAAVVYDEISAKLAKEHNDANVVCMAGRLMSPAQMESCLLAFMKAKFLGGRYAERNAMLDE